MAANGSSAAGEHAYPCVAPAACGEHEDGLGEVELPGDPLHTRRWDAARIGEDGDGISSSGVWVKTSTTTYRYIANKLFYYVAASSHWAPRPVASRTTTHYRNLPVRPSQDGAAARLVGPGDRGRDRGGLSPWPARRAGPAESSNDARAAPTRWSCGRRAVLLMLAGAAVSKFASWPPVVTAVLVFPVFAGTGLTLSARAARR